MILHYFHDIAKTSRYYIIIHALRNITGYYNINVILQGKRTNTTLGEDRLTYTHGSTSTFGRRPCPKGQTPKLILFLLHLRNATCRINR